MINANNLKLTGYRRPDGRYGVRNHVIILPVDDISNAAAEGVAALIRVPRPPFVRDTVVRITGPCLMPPSPCEAPEFSPIGPGPDDPAAGQASVAPRSTDATATPSSRSAG